MRVTAPDGRIWEVERRFRWPRLRDPEFDESLLGWLDFSDLGGLIASIVLGLALAVVIFILLPPILFLLELLFVVFALVTTIRPWLVVAETHNESHEWKVRGWRKSRRAIREIAYQLRKGEVQPQETWQ